MQSLRCYQSSFLGKTIIVRGNLNIYVENAPSINIPQNVPLK